MPVTVPVTVYVPDVVVRHLSTEGDLVVAEPQMGSPPEQWSTDALKEESKELLLKFREPNEDYKQMYSALMLIMRQPKRVLEGGALKEFLEAIRPDAIAAFVQKYGVFKIPESHPEKIRVSVRDFRSEQKRLRALLGVWTKLREGEPEDAPAVGRDAGLEFAGDPHFALSAHLTSKLAHRSILTLIATKGRLEPMLYCRDVITGLYALLFQAVVAGKPWAICLNCANAFSVDRVGKKFCGEPCQQAYKQRRYRGELKRKTQRHKKRR